VVVVAESIWVRCGSGLGEAAWVWHSSIAREVRWLVWINTWVDGRSASGIVACMNPANHPVPGHRFSINNTNANCSRKSPYFAKYNKVQQDMPLEAEGQGMRATGGCDECGVLKHIADLFTLQSCMF
jgi:hypothetical protein